MTNKRTLWNSNNHFVSNMITYKTKPKDIYVTTRFMLSS